MEQAKEALPLLFDRTTFVERLLEKHKDALIWEKPKGFDVYDFHVDFSSTPSDANSNTPSDPNAEATVRAGSFAVGAGDTADLVGMAVVPQVQRQGRHRGSVILSGHCPADDPTAPGE